MRKFWFNYKYTFTLPLPNIGWREREYMERWLGR